MQNLLQLGPEHSLREAAALMDPDDEIHLDRAAVTFLVDRLDDLEWAVSIHGPTCNGCMALVAGELLAPDHTCR